jgi:hypothetical protein
MKITAQYLFIFGVLLSRLNLEVYLSRNSAVAMCALTLVLSIYQSMALQLFVGPWPNFNVLSFYTVSSIPWTGDQPVARPVSAHITAQTQNKRTETSMPQMGLEPTIRVFERAKTVHALDSAATVIGNQRRFGI